MQDTHNWAKLASRYTDYDIQKINSLSRHKRKEKCLKHFKTQTGLGETDKYESKWIPEVCRMDTYRLEQAALNQQGKRTHDIH
jgi:hypothetical protein